MRAKRARPKLDGILLAAGASRRMGGRAKAGMRVGGETVLERLVRVFRDGGARRVIVVVSPELERIVPRLSRVDLRINPDPERGQTSSLQVGVAALERDAEGFFFHPVDVPFVEPEDVRALVLAFARAREEEAVFIPSHGGCRGHPPLLRASLAREILALRHDEPASRVVTGKPERIVPVEVANPYVLRDFDTPADFERLLREKGLA